MLAVVAGHWGGEEKDRVACESDHHEDGEGRGIVACHSRRRRHDPAGQQRLNDEVSRNDLHADSHVLPAVHISHTPKQALTLSEYIKNTSKPLATRSSVLIRKSDHQS